MRKTSYVPVLATIPLIFHASFLFTINWITPPPSDEIWECLEAIWRVLRLIYDRDQIGLIYLKFYKRHFNRVAIAAWNGNQIMLIRILRFVKMKMNEGNNKFKKHFLQRFLKNITGTIYFCNLIWRVFRDED